MHRQTIIAVFFLPLFLVACEKPAPPPHAGDSDEYKRALAANPATVPVIEPLLSDPDSQGHRHTPPHGGRLVELGADRVFVEICLNANLGEIAVYITDGEKPVRIGQPTLEIAAAVPNAAAARHTWTLVVPARENPFSGDTAGGAAEFRCRHDYLRELESLEGTISSITVRGRKYEHVHFLADILADK